MATMGWFSRRWPLAILLLIILSVNQRAAKTTESPKRFYSAVYFDTAVLPGDARKFCRSFGQDERSLGFRSDADLVMMKTTAQVQAVRELVAVAELRCETNSDWEHLDCLPTIGLIISNRSKTLSWVDGSALEAQTIGLDGYRQDPPGTCQYLPGVCNCTVLNHRMALIEVPCGEPFQYTFRIACQATTTDTYERMIQNASALCGSFALDSDGPTSWTASCKPPPPLPDPTASTDSQKTSPEPSTTLSTTTVISTATPTPTTAVEIKTTTTPDSTTISALSIRTPDPAIIPAITTTSQEPMAVLQPTVASAEPAPMVAFYSVVMFEDHPSNRRRKRENPDPRVFCKQFGEDAEPIEQTSFEIPEIVLNGSRNSNKRPKITLKKSPMANKAGLIAISQDDDGSEIKVTAQCRPPTQCKCATRVLTLTTNFTLQHCVHPYNGVCQATDQDTYQKMIRDSAARCAIVIRAVGDPSISDNACPLFRSPAPTAVPKTTARGTESPTAEPEGDTYLTSVAKKIGMAAGGVGVLAAIVGISSAVWSWLSDNYANWRFDRDHMEKTADDASMLAAIGKFLFMRSIILVSLCEIVEANRKEKTRRQKRTSVRKKGTVFDGAADRAVSTTVHPNHPIHPIKPTEIEKPGYALSNSLPGINDQKFTPKEVKGSKKKSKTDEAQAPKQAPRRKAEDLAAIFLAQKNSKSDLYKIKCSLKVILKFINQGEMATVDEYEKAINDALRMNLKVVIVKGVIKYAATGED